MAMKKIKNFFKKIKIVNIIINFINNRIIKKQNMKNDKGFFKSIIQMLLNLINFDKLDIELTIDYNADDPEKWDIFLEIWYNGKLIKVFEFIKDNRKVRKVGANNTELHFKLPDFEIEKFINNEIKNI